MVCMDGCVSGDADNDPEWFIVESVRVISNRENGPTDFCAIRQFNVLVAFFWQPKPPWRPSSFSPNHCVCVWVCVSSRDDNVGANSFGSSSMMDQLLLDMSNPRKFKNMHIIQNHFHVELFSVAGVIIVG